MQRNDRMVTLMVTLTDGRVFNDTLPYWLANLLGEIALSVGEVERVQVFEHDPDA